MSSARSGSLPARSASRDGARELVRERARELGFCGVGFASVAPLEDARAHLERWLDRGYQGRLKYLEKPADRADPRTWVPEAKSGVVVALALPDPDLADQPDDPLLGELARFARYRSYQTVVHGRLKKLQETLGDLLARPVAGASGADSAPLLERALAVRAGMGFIAESALLALPGHGTQVVLGELLVDAEIEPQAALDHRCRGCGACREACPTGALRDPFVVDARRCVSYWTQTSGMVPRELRPAMGRWIYGCDVCQRVCPENRQTSRPLLCPDLGQPLARPALVDLLLARGQAQCRLVGTGRLAEVEPNLLARNAAIALGNARKEPAFRALARAVEEHASPIVRAHAAWSLGSYAGPPVRGLLEHVAGHDPDGRVRAEALGRLERGSD